MKVLTALILCAVLILGTFTACGTQDPAQTTTESDTPAVTTTASEQEVSTTAAPQQTTTQASGETPIPTKKPSTTDFLDLLSVAKAKIRESGQVNSAFRTISETETNGSVLTMRYDTGYRTDFRDRTAPLMSYMTTVYSPDPSAEIVYYYKDNYFYTSLSGERFKRQMTPDEFMTLVAENPIMWLTRYSADSQKYLSVTEFYDGSLCAEIELVTAPYLAPILDLITILSEEVHDPASLTEISPTKLTVTVSADGVLTGYTIEIRFKAVSASGVIRSYRYSITETEKPLNDVAFIPGYSELNTFTDVTGKDLPTRPNKPVAPQS
ncbi:MAG: hypothetical protein IJV98_08860 [Clostridia bacterium]|nr:hypothetical protein [Clostridia bacterium]